MKFWLTLALGWVSSSAVAGPHGVKSLFLNGIDISSARSQELKNVDVMINEHGDVFLVAPHYQVNEEDTYVPLSKFAKGLGSVVHKPAQMLGKPPGPDERDSASQKTAKSAENTENTKSNGENSDLRGAGSQGPEKAKGIEADTSQDVPKMTSGKDSDPKTQDTPTDEDRKETTGGKAEEPKPKEEAT